ncbi:hypothetical protein PILCRDRAFT_814816 [Piloderma croceum F 1598]|uniref:Uncharacterized protein n=1 Tax=Piloderma croceum (strain F 1598) TaxID=765440 RepID=A0A0C3G9M4_PILCF|nr:hypothetical protein PILCRDRAFT_814816 [Piloderma croceum F 1598]
MTHDLSMAGTGPSSNFCRRMTLFETVHPIYLSGPAELTLRRYSNWNIVEHDNAEEVDLMTHIRRRMV